jgi:hypothetical protein
MSDNKVLRARAEAVFKTKPNETGKASDEHEAKSRAIAEKTQRCENFARRSPDSESCRPGRLGCVFGLKCRQQIKLLTHQYPPDLPHHHEPRRRATTPPITAPVAAFQTILGSARTGPMRAQIIRSRQAELRRSFRAHRPHQH